MEAQRLAQQRLGCPRETPISALDLAGNIDLTGKRALVTGASSGIGFCTAQALARAGAEVVLAARPGDKLDRAQAALAEQFPGQSSALAVDLLSSISVIAAAQRCADTALDILIHNAGVIGPLAYSSEGVEAGFMVNALAPALLTSRLAGSLRPGARIAFVCSFGHHHSPVIFEDVNFRHRPYDPWSSYGQSKSAASLLAIHVSQALAHRGIDAFSLHPGAIKTEMSRALTVEEMSLPQRMGSTLTAADFISPEEGAATSFWAVTAAELSGHGGLYLENCGVAEVLDAPNYFCGVMPHAIDPEQARRIWPLMESLLGEELPL